MVEQVDRAVMDESFDQVGRNVENSRNLHASLTPNHGMVQLVESLAELTMIDA